MLWRALQGIVGKVDISGRGTGLGMGIGHAVF